MDLDGRPDKFQVSACKQNRASKANQVHIYFEIGKTPLFLKLVLRNGQTYLKLSHNVPEADAQLEEVHPKCLKFEKLYTI